MKTIIVPRQDLWDESSERFIVVEETKLLLEHSLLSLSEWESEYEKPYIVSNPRLAQPRTRKETLDYVKCMTLNHDEVTDENVYLALSDTQLREIDTYINDKRTATTFAKNPNERPGGKFITSELIYYWMSTFNIPYIPCESWHLNRLLTLIKVCSEEQKAPEKKSKRSTMEDQRRLNQQRRKALGTNG